VISPQQTRSFVNGVIKCADVQQPDPTQLADFADRSRFAGSGTLPGTKFTVRGTAAGAYGALYYIVDEDGGQRGGMSVFAPIAPLTPGTRYRIAGQCQEFDFETELVNSTLITNEGAGTLPAPNVQTVGTFADTTTDMTQSTLTGEDFEGMLVKVSYAQVTENRATGQDFFIAGQKPSYPDTIIVQNLNGVLSSYTPPESLMTVDVTGMLHYTAGRFRICPRSAADIVNHGLNVGVDQNQITELSFSVAPNPARVSQLSFALPRADQVDLGVFDLQGRQVASLARGRLPAGAYSRSWAGTDAAGKRVNPGMYFYRLRVGSETRVVRGVLLQ
jgi:flagellar hook assembly protein FlgD